MGAGVILAVKAGTVDQGFPIAKSRPGFSVDRKGLGAAANRSLLLSGK